LGHAGGRSSPVAWAYGKSRCFGAAAVTFTSESSGYLLLWMNGGPGGGGAVTVDITGGDPASTEPSSQPRAPLADPALFAGACNPTFSFRAEHPEGAKIVTDAIQDMPTWFGAIARDVCSRLYKSPGEVPTVNSLEFSVRDCYGTAFANPGRAARIWMCTSWLRNTSNSDQDIAAIVSGVMAHETAHVFQHRGRPEMGGRLSPITEGTAEVVRLSAGSLTPAQCVEGSRWDRGYAVTACFLVWLDLRYNDFFYQFNQGLRPYAEPWSEAEFVRLTGKPVTELWAEYQEALRATSSPT
jgi:hypothetical protein